MCVCQQAMHLSFLQFTCHLRILGSAHSTPDKFETGAFTPKTHQIFSVNATPEKRSTPKTHQMSVHTTLEKFENATDHGRQKSLGAPLRVRVKHMIINTASFSKPSVFKLFFHTETPARPFQTPPVCIGFSKSSVFGTD